MRTRTIVLNFQKDGIIPDEFVTSVEKNRELRVDLADHFKRDADREFVIHLLDKMILYRKQKDTGVSGDSIMRVCYLLGLHKNIEDCLSIWNATTTDFDSFCYIDIQLVPFAGLDDTIAFLKTVKTDNAQDAFDLHT